MIQVGEVLPGRKKAELHIRLMAFAAGNQDEMRSWQPPHRHTKI